MTGILLSSQVQRYYDLRNLFLVLSAFFLVSAAIYGIRIHIIRVLQKHFGIEKRREIKRMKKGSRNTSGRLRPIRYTGKSLSGSMQGRGNVTISPFVSGKMQREVSEISGKMQRNITEASGKMQRNIPEASGKMPQEIPETVVLEGTEETVVLSQQQETVVLQTEDNAGFYKKKDLVIVHGEDIG